MISEDRKHELIGADCTLDGKAARIIDRGGFAYVEQHQGLGAEWSWEAASRIMNQDRAFWS